MVGPHMGGAPGVGIRPPDPPGEQAGDGNNNAGTAFGAPAALRVTGVAVPQIPEPRMKAI